MGCLSSKNKGLRIITFTTCESYSDAVEDDFSSLNDSAGNHTATFNILHNENYANSRRPTSPLSLLTASIRKTFPRSQPPAPTLSFPDLLSHEHLFHRVTQYLGSSHVFAGVCVKFHDLVVSLENRREPLLSSVTDIEYCGNMNGFSVDDEEGTCHSSILEDDGYWSRPASSPRPPLPLRADDHEHTTLSRESSTCISWESITPCSHADGLAAGINMNTDTDIPNDETLFWHRDFDWLSTPFQNFHQISATKKLHAEDVPAGSAVDFSGSNSAHGVILPAHIVQHHHQHPYQSSLYIPKLKYPGTIVAVSCFTYLQHLALGCIGSQADCSVTDYDIAVVVDSLGEQLLSIRLLKLNGLSTATVAMITANCVRLTVLVVFGCESMRAKERNSTNIQRAFKAFETEEGSQPRVFVPLSTAPVVPIEDYIFSSYGSADEAEGRKLDLLDVRYSIDLNDALLTEIMNAFVGIDMFLGSNMHTGAVAPSSAASARNDEYGENQGRSLNLTLDLEITDGCWNLFREHYASDSNVLFIDDFTRERNSSCLQWDPVQSAVLLSVSGARESTPKVNLGAAGGESDDLATAEPISASCALERPQVHQEFDPDSKRMPPTLGHRIPPPLVRRQQLKEALLAKLPTYIDPDLFADDDAALPGSE